MDPVGPWTAAYAASYNRLTAAGGFQPTGGAAEFPHPSSNVPPSTSSQLLLQAAPGSVPPFNPGGFLPPSPVAYDSVFSPFLHHANQKAHPYTQALNVAQHRPSVSTTKLSTGDSTSTRDPYNSINPQSLAPSPFFEQPPAAVQTSLPWTHQNNSQLPSPFGILPHESVVGNRSGGSSTTKLATAYENLNAAHFAAAQTLNHINSQLVAVSYSDVSKKIVTPSSQSPLPKINTSVTSSMNYYHQSSSGNHSRSENQYPPTKSQHVKTEYGSEDDTFRNPNVSVQLTQNNPSKDCNQVGSGSSGFPILHEKQAVSSTSGFQPPASKTSVPTPPLPGKLKSHTERRSSSHESSQSSPISYAMIDQQRLSSKICVPNRPVVNNNLQQSQLQQQLVPHQKQSPYHGYSANSNPIQESDYIQARNRSSSDGGYSSSSSISQTGGECNNLQRSPLNHSQPSPLGHVTSPAAYPVYHSPAMASMSSPSPVQHPDQNGGYKQQPSPQVAPTSPLDASISKPSPVGYSSVITRSDPNFSTDSGNLEYPQKQCWENSESQLIQNNHLKFTGRPLETSQNFNSFPSQQRNLLGLTERQQAYFDPSASHSATINRGDPMSLVKNLQQSQALGYPAVDEKPMLGNAKVNSNSKKKRALDNRVDNIGYSSSRVPPPAHVNMNLPQQSVDFRRPNASLSTKMKLDDSETHNSQYTGLRPQLNTANNTLCSQSTSRPQITNRPILAQPVETDVLDKTSVAKVIVPDVEEELNFLTDNSKKILKCGKKNKKNDAVDIKPVFPCVNSNSGFISSYLKFLQGGKEESPPPQTRLKKTAYITSAKTNSQNNSKKSTTSKLNPPSPPPNTEDDPRYFPLPKSSSERKLDSSSDAESVNEEKVSTEENSQSAESVPRNSNVKNKRPAHYQKKTAANKRSTRKSKKRNISSSDEESKPRRTRAKRKAKDKIISLNDGSDHDLFSGNSDSDPAWSPLDSKVSDEDRFRRSRRSLNTKSMSIEEGGSPVTPPPSRFLESSDEETNSSLSNVNDKKRQDCCHICKGVCNDPKESVKCSHCKNSYHAECCSLASVQKIKRLRSKRSSWKCDDCKAYLNKSRRNGRTKKGRTSSLINEKLSDDDSLDTFGTEDYFPFKSGEFIVVKAELKNEYPSIWRVDGKTLLQKYEPFDQNGEKLYRNISTYSGWTPQHRNIYEKIPVQFVLQSRQETIVKFLRSEMVDPAQEQAFLDQSLAETAKYQDNFEVYIQTLISQALDSNFLAEIFAEKDEYFLQNVEVIDSLTEERRSRLVVAVDWPSDSEIQRSVAVWPCYNVLAELRPPNLRMCDACSCNKVHARIILYGQPYNATTLDALPPDSQPHDQKDFMICLDCIKRVQLYNKLVHQKYIMYIECAKRVAERRSTDPNKETTVILNELLADEEWLTKLFRQVRVTWADVEKAEREKNKRSGVSDSKPSVNCPANNITTTTTPTNSSANIQSEVSVKQGEAAAATEAMVQQPEIPETQSANHSEDKSVVENTDFTVQDDTFQKIDEPTELVDGVDNQTS